MERITYHSAEHLIAAAYTKERCTRLHTLPYRSLKPRFTDVDHILCRILRAGQEDKIRRPQFCGGTHIVKRNVRLAGERIKVREVREFRRADDGDPQLVTARSAIPIVLLIERYGILLVNAKLLDVRDNAEHGLARPFL